jgi:hypothetical protein
MHRVGARGCFAPDPTIDSPTCLPGSPTNTSTIDRHDAQVRGRSLLAELGASPFTIPFFLTLSLFAHPFFTIRSG